MSAGKITSGTIGLRMIPAYIPNAARATSVGPVFMMDMFTALTLAIFSPFLISSPRTCSTSSRSGSSHAFSFNILTPLSASFCSFTRLSVSFI